LRSVPFAAVGESDVFDGGAFGSKPALSSNVTREHALLGFAAQFGCYTRSPRLHALGAEAVPAVDEYEHGQVVPDQTLFMPRWRFHFATQLEPVKPVAGQRQQVRQVAHGWKRRTPQKLDRHRALVRRKIQLHRLRRAREIRDAKNRVLAVLTQVHQHLAIARTNELHRPAPERL